MAQREKGAAAHIAELHGTPRPSIPNCAARALNLCVVECWRMECCSILEIRNAMDTADSIV